MARIRTIKPGFFRSYDVIPLSYRARLTWIGLWTYVDDEGRGRDDARIIKGELWPLEDDVTWQEVEADLTELSRSAHVVRYEVSGRHFLAIPTWQDHQVISRPTKSKLPSVDDGLIRHFGELTEHSVSTHGVLPAGSGSGSGKGSGSGTGKPAPAVLASVFDEAWEHWPKKVERKQACEKFQAAVKRYPGAPEDLALAVARFGDAYAATTERRFVPALGVWLAHERWTDEIPQPSTPAPIGKGHTRDLEWEAQMERARLFDEQRERVEIEQ